MFGIRKHPPQGKARDLPPQQAQLIEEIKEAQKQLDQVRAKTLALNPTQSATMGASNRISAYAEYKFILPKAITDEDLKAELASLEARITRAERLYQYALEAYTVEVRWVATPMLRIIRAAPEGAQILSDFDVEIILKEETVIKAYTEAIAEFKAKNAEVVFENFEVDIEEFKESVRILKADPNFNLKVLALTSN